MNFGSAVDSNYGSVLQLRALVTQATQIGISGFSDRNRFGPRSGNPTHGENGVTVSDVVDDKGNTLLHLSVMHDLPECVVKLLAAGADPKGPLNSEACSPEDLALDAGNQQLLQILDRRGDFMTQLTSFSALASLHPDLRANCLSKTLGSSTMASMGLGISPTLDSSTPLSGDLYSRVTNISLDIPVYGGNSPGLHNFAAGSTRDTRASDAVAEMLLLPTFSALAPPRTVFEDYWDWTDSVCNMQLKKFIDELKEEEKHLTERVWALERQRAHVAHRQMLLHRSLREKEHAMCLAVWEMVQIERRCRQVLEHTSERVAELKRQLQSELEAVHWSGPLQVSPFRGAHLLRLWRTAVVSIAGAAITIAVQSNRRPKGSKGLGRDTISGSSGGGGGSYDGSGQKQQGQGDGDDATTDFDSSYSSWQFKSQDQSQHGSSFSVFSLLSASHQCYSQSPSQQHYPHHHPMPQSQAHDEDAEEDVHTITSACSDSRAVTSQVNTTASSSSTRGGRRGIGRAQSTDPSSSPYVSAMLSAHDNSPHRAFLHETTTAGSPASSASFTAASTSSPSTASPAYDPASKSMALAGGGAGGRAGGRAGTGVVERKEPYLSLRTGPLRRKLRRSRDSFVGHFIGPLRQISLQSIVEVEINRPILSSPASGASGATKNRSKGRNKDKDSVHSDNGEEVAGRGCSGASRGARSGYVLVGIHYLKLPPASVTEQMEVMLAAPTPNAPPNVSAAAPAATAVAASTANDQPSVLCEDLDVFKLKGGATEGASESMDRDNSRSNSRDNSKDSCGGSEVRDLVGKLQVDEHRQLDPSPAAGAARRRAQLGQQEQHQKVDCIWLRLPYFAPADASPPSPATAAFAPTTACPKSSSGNDCITSQATFEMHGSGYAPYSSPTASLGFSSAGTSPPSSNSSSSMSPAAAFSHSQQQASSQTGAATTLGEAGCLSVDRLVFLLRSLREDIKISQHSEGSTAAAAVTAAAVAADASDGHGVNLATDSTVSSGSSGVTAGPPQQFHSPQTTHGELIYHEEWTQRLVLQEEGEHAQRPVAAIGNIRHLLNIERRFSEGDDCTAAAAAAVVASTHAPSAEQAVVDQGLSVLSASAAASAIAAGPPPYSSAADSDSDLDTDVDGREVAGTGTADLLRAGGAISMHSQHGQYGHKCGPSTAHPHSRGYSRPTGALVGPPRIPTDTDPPMGCRSMPFYGMPTTAHKTPAVLCRAIFAARNRRTRATAKLVRVITKREQTLERMKYVQALRAVVDEPPGLPEPVRSLSQVLPPPPQPSTQHKASMSKPPHTAVGVTTHALYPPLARAKNGASILTQQSTPDAPSSSQPPSHLVQAFNMLMQYRECIAGFSTTRSLTPAHSLPSTPARRHDQSAMGRGPGTPSTSLPPTPATPTTPVAAVVAAASLGSPAPYSYGAGAYSYSTPRGARGLGPAASSIPIGAGYGMTWAETPGRTTPGAAASGGGGGGGNTHTSPTPDMIALVSFLLHTSNAYCATDFAPVTGHLPPTPPPTPGLGQGPRLGLRRHLTQPAASPSTPQRIGGQIDSSSRLHASLSLPPGPPLSADLMYDTLRLSLDNPECPHSSGAEAEATAAVNQETHAEDGSACIRNASAGAGVLAQRGLPAFNPLFRSEFFEVLTQLESTWELETSSFDIAQRLLQTIVLKEVAQRRRRGLEQLQQRQSEGQLGQEDLYEIEL